MAETQRIFGYNGKILKVNLSAGQIEIDQPDPAFYRTYLGGGLVGAYYLFRGTKPGISPLSPANVLVFAPSVTTGAPVTGASRFNVTAKSPVTGAIGDTQCGGGFGPKLKQSGFDAVVVTGRSPKPVYLWLDRGKAEIRDAAQLWGKVTGDAQRLIQEELGDNKIEIALIGPAGENLVSFACITGGLSHFAGRTGMGAVMGSKNLKAIAVRGEKPYPFFDEAGVKALARKGAQAFKNSEIHQNFQKHGTALGMSWFKDMGQIVTRNFQSGWFDRTDDITGQQLTASLLKETDTCWSCVVRCKRVVEAEEPYRIEAQYGGPEYETISMLGSNVGVGDLSTICKANEICNKHTMDTISAGGMIAFAMECFERGLITAQQTSGLDLKFGNGQAVLDLLELIARREGVGDILAGGYERAIDEWGEACRPYAIQVKNQSFPAHMPRIKPGQGLMYAVNPFGADHMSSEHDWVAVAQGDVSQGLGVTEFTNMESLDLAKVRATMLSQFFYSLLDTLTVCDFCYGPGSLFGYRDLEQLVEATTGWRMTFWELMRAGERRVNLMRAYNAREGFGRNEDRLPQRVFEPLPDGPSAGRKLDPNDFEEALDHYYSMMGWDLETGRPSEGRLKELGLGWATGDLSYYK